MSGTEDGQIEVGTANYTPLFVLTKDDREFLSAAREDIPALLAEVRRLRDGVEDA